MWRHRSRIVDQVSDDTGNRALEGGRWGGPFASAISGFALLFSSYSFYESVLRAPEFSAYVPPRIDYTDPDRPDSPFEVFVVPLTIANDGARAGTVLAITMTVTNLRSRETKEFYAASLGTWGVEPRRPFAPIALSGKASFSDSIQFMPLQDETVARILDLEPGRYGFEVRMETASVSQPWPFDGQEIAPLRFEREIGQLDYRFFSGTNTMAMWSADHKASSNRP